MFAAADVSEPLDPFATLIDLAVSLWWLWPLLIVFAVARQLLEGGGQRNRRRQRASSRPAQRGSVNRRRHGSSQPVASKPQPASIGEIDGMTGTQFEKRLVELFRADGYSVTHTGKLGDFGADLVIERNGTRTVVQAKRWSNQVGIDAVREALAAKGLYECAEAMVVTNSTFTWRAKKLAAANDVHLRDRAYLLSLLKSASNASGKHVVDAPATAEPAVAFCARCGAEVSDRVRDYCVQHAKRFGGLIYCFKHQRHV